MPPTRPFWGSGSWFVARETAGDGSRTANHCPGKEKRFRPNDPNDPNVPNDPIRCIISKASDNRTPRGVLCPPRRFWSNTVDAFSWFRQRRLSPPGRPLPLTEDVRIPLLPTPTVGLVVYCRYSTERSLPSEQEAEDIIWNWIQEGTEEPLREAVIAFIEQSNLTMELHERDDVPPPPDGLLRAYNPGETEERRYREATHAVVIEAHDLLLPPRVGLWAALAAARALASSLTGAVILDPEYPRLLPLNVANEPLPAEGHIRVVDHILIPYSTDPKTGLLWMTTKGMSRFGLPDLELKDVPPNLAPSLMPVINGVAQHLVESAMNHAQEVGPSGGFERVSVLPMKAEFPFTMDDIRRAYARSEEEAERMAEEDAETDAESDAIGETQFRLEVVGGSRRQPPLVRLLPSQETGADTSESGVWLNSLLGDLFGSDPELAMVETGDEQMEAAHEQALNELPLVRARFQAGFQSGEVLHIKHGFPTTGDNHEYMWIAVTGWKDGRIRGRLANDPQYRRDLRAGQSVEIGEEEVYDWLIVHTDGRTEGAYTNRALTEERE